METVLYTYEIGKPLHLGSHHTDARAHASHPSCESPLWVNPLLISALSMV